MDKDHVYKVLGDYNIGTEYFTAIVPDSIRLLSDFEFLNATSILI